MNTATDDKKEIGYAQCLSDLGDLIKAKYPKHIPDEVFDLWLKLTLKQSERYDPTVLQS